VAKNARAKAEKVPKNNSAGRWGGLLTSQLTWKGLQGAGAGAHAGQ
jgi:hypothetical protein